MVAPGGSAAGVRVIAERNRSRLPAPGRCPLVRQRLDLAGYLDEKQQTKLNRLYTPKKPPSEDVKNYEKRLANFQQAVALAQAQLGPLAEEILALEDFWRLNQTQWMWLLRQNLGQVSSTD